MTDKSYFSKFILFSKYLLNEIWKAIQQWIGFLICCHFAISAQKFILLTSCVILYDFTVKIFKVLLSILFLFHVCKLVLAKEKKKIFPKSHKNILPFFQFPQNFLILQFFKRSKVLLSPLHTLSAIFGKSPPQKKFWIFTTEHPWISAHILLNLKN